MDKVLLYYDYEAALASYEERLMKINRHGKGIAR